MFSLILWGTLALSNASADEPSSIELENGAKIYSSEAKVDDRPMIWNRRFWNRGAQVCGTATWADGVVSGRAVVVKPGIARVELPEIPKSCAQDFKGRQSRYVYVKTSDIKFKDAEGNVVATPDPMLNDDSAETAAGLQVCAPGDPKCEPNELKAILAAMSKSGPVKDDYQKDPAQQELYFACHATPLQANYEKIYRKVFDIAERAFNASYDSEKNKTRAILNPNELQDQAGSPFFLRVSSSALKCLSLRESRWDPLMKSPTGAVGITQQVSRNIKDVECRVHGCTLNGKAQKAEPWATDLWGNFFDELRMKENRSVYEAAMINPENGKRCKEQMTSKADAMCPANSIASGALNAMLAQASIRRNSFLRKSQKNIDLGGKDAYYALVIAAAANNAGSGTLAKAIASGEKPTEWLKHLDQYEKDPERQKEIRDYAKYMDHCMKKDDFAPVDPIRPGEEGRDWKKYCEDKVRPKRTASK